MGTWICQQNWTRLASQNCFSWANDHWTIAMYRSSLSDVLSTIELIITSFIEPLFFVVRILAFGMLSQHINCQCDVTSCSPSCSQIGVWRLEPSCVQCSQSDTWYKSFSYLSLSSTSLVLKPNWRRKGCRDKSQNLCNFRVRINKCFVWNHKYLAAQLKYFYFCSCIILPFKNLE